MTADPAPRVPAPGRYVGPPPVLPAAVLVVTRALSLAVGALQILLDRGSLKDWFSSTEIWIYAITTLIAFYLFIVHSATARDPFINFKMFKDRNFSAGSLFIVLVGPAGITLVTSFGQL